MIRTTRLVVLLLLLHLTLSGEHRTPHLDKSLSCDFENHKKPFCDYKQETTDDSDWNKEINDGNTVLSFTTLTRSIGEVARLYGPQITLQETHCVKFRYSIVPESTRRTRSDRDMSPSGRNWGSLTGSALSSVQLSIFIVEDHTDWAYQKPVWHSSTPTTKFQNVELSLVPDKYRLVFEARVLSSSTTDPFKVMVDAIRVEKRRCDRSPHFLRLASLEMNRGQSGAFTCKLADYNLSKYLPSSQLDTHINGEEVSEKKIQLRLEVSGGETSIRPDSLPMVLDQMHIEARFSFSPATDQISGKYRCVVKEPHHAGVSNYATLSVKVPPSPMFSPLVMTKGSTHLILNLNSGSFRGNGPIISTKLQYQPVGGEWIDTHPILLSDSTRAKGLSTRSLDTVVNSGVSDVNQTVYRLWNLVPDTFYEYRVILSRPGLGGQGQPGPSLKTKTSCAKPVSGIKGIEAQPHGSDRISLIWDKPYLSATRCSAYSYEVRYKQTKKKGKFQKIPIQNPDQLGIELTHLAPFIEYEIYVDIRNSAGNQTSEPVFVKTDEDVPGMIQRSSVKAIKSECGTEVTLSWQKPTTSNGQLLRYEIAYEASHTWTEVGPANKVVLRKTETMIVRPDASSATITDLYPGTSYKFTIRAATKKGYGPGTSINLRTSVGPPKMPSYDNTNTPVISVEQRGKILLALYPAISNGAPIEKYQIIVQNVTLTANHDRQSRSIMPSCPHKTKYSFGEHLSSNYWVCGELPSQKFHLDERIQFRVGDNSTKWKYYNPPLTTGTFDIWYYAFTKKMNEDNSAVENCIKLARLDVDDSETLLPTVVAMYNIGDDPYRNNDGSRVIGVITTGNPDKVSATLILVGLLLLLIVTIIVAYYAVVQRKNKARSNNGNRSNKTRDTSPHSFINNCTTQDSDSLKYNRKDKGFDVNIFSDAKTEIIHPHSPGESSPLLFDGGKADAMSPYNDSGYIAPSLSRRPLPDLITHNLSQSNTRTPTPQKAGVNTPPIFISGTLKSNNSSITTSKVHNNSSIRVEDFPIAVNQMKQSNICGFAADFDTIMNLEGPCEVANRLENRTKNRSQKVIPFDYSRVKIRSSPVLVNDYINASYINGYRTPVAYIATQAPLDTTVIDLWDMAWHENARVIVMLTKLLEQGYNQCAIYWPSQQGIPTMFGHIVVTLTGVEHLSNYTIRSFQIRHADAPESESRQILQFQLTCWPERGVPARATAMLEFMRRVKSVTPDKHATIVHCTTGAGRTGCFIALDMALDMAREEGLIDIRGLVEGLRSRRPYMVETLQQYEWLHDAALEAVLCGDTCVYGTELTSHYDHLITYDNVCGQAPIIEEFETLVIMTPKLNVQQHCSTSLMLKNKHKNRFADVLPADAHLPQLSLDGRWFSSNDQSYINATLCDSYKRPGEIIITQTPQPQTAVDFWRLVWDYGVYSIVMVDDLGEHDESCQIYWPRGSLSNNNTADRARLVSQHSNGKNSDGMDDTLSSSNNSDLSPNRGIGCRGTRADTPISSCTSNANAGELVLRFGPFEIELLTKSDEIDLAVRTFKITKKINPISGMTVSSTLDSTNSSSINSRHLRNTETKIIKHFQLLAWPPKNAVPTSRNSTLRIISLLQKHRKEVALNIGQTITPIDGPEAPAPRMLVHCIAGAGRSGTFACCYNVIEQLMAEKTADIFSQALKLRSHRPQLIESMDQYRFVYEVAGTFFDDTFDNNKS